MPEIPENAWADQIRRQMQHAADYCGAIPWQKAADFAIEWLTPLYARIADLEEDVTSLGGNGDQTEAPAAGYADSMGDLECQERATAADAPVFDRAARPAPPTFPAMVEVPAKDAKVGDLLTCVRTITEVTAGSAWFEDGAEIPLNGPGVTVTRPVTPLPKEPGAVGTATVRGVRVRAVRVNDGVIGSWVTTPVVAGSYWSDDADLSDYVPLLPGAGVVSPGTEG